VLGIKTGISVDDVDPYIDLMANVRQMPKEKLKGLDGAIKGFLQDPPYPLQPDA
jgi:hypothetical protein